MYVGLTGGIACGKSTVSGFLSELGAKIVDADRIAREVVLPGRPALREIEETFGRRVMNEDGTLNRKELGAIVFSDESLRRKLESITHPRIRQEMLSQMQYWNELDPGLLVVADIPLLFESKLDKLLSFEEIIVVYVPEHTQIERLIHRDGLSGKEARKRIASQMPIEEKRRLADVVIDNSGTQEQTRRQVERYVANKKGSV